MKAMATHFINLLLRLSRISPIVAPFTFRIPISFVRCSAIKAAKERSPKQAIRIANTENIETIFLVLSSASYKRPKSLSKNT